MKTLFVKCAALVLAIQVASAQNFLSMARSCSENHIERLNECILEAVKKIQPRITAEGLPELNLPRLEPLDIGSFNLSQNQGPVNFKADFKDLQVSGLGRINFGYLDFNHQNLTVSLGLTVPALTIRGKYNINGTVFDLPVEGTGPFIALLEGIVVEGFQRMKTQNVRVTSIDSVNVNIKIHKFRSKVENLFGGNEILGNTFTHFIEENSNLVLEELRPTLVGTLNAFLTNLSNGILYSLPTDIRDTHPDANKLDKHRARTLRIQAQSKQQ